MAMLISTRSSAVAVRSSKQLLPASASRTVHTPLRRVQTNQLVGTPSRQFVQPKRDVVACAEASDAAASGDVIVKSTALRSLSFVSFWAQLALTLASGGVFAFSMMFGNANSTADITKWLTLVGIVCSLLSTFFAHGFNTLAKKVESGQVVQRAWVVNSLLRNSTLNFWGIGATLVGLQAAVGTLVAKTLLTSATNPYNPTSAANSLISLDVFSLQASTNTLLAHFVSLLLINITLRFVNKPSSPPPATA